MIKSHSNRHKKEVNRNKMKLRNTIIVLSAEATHDSGFVSQAERIHLCLCNWYDVCIFIVYQ